MFECKMFSSAKSPWAIQLKGVLGLPDDWRAASGASEAALVLEEVSEVKRQGVKICIIDSI